MLIPLMGAIFWKRATTVGAIASMGMGFATALLFMFKDGMDANTPIYYSLGVGLVSFVVVSLLSPRPATMASAAQAEPNDLMLSSTGVASVATPVFFRL